MATTYTTSSGDTWDAIAFSVYGSEKYMGWLMQSNPAYVDRLVFEAGVVLQTPELTETATADAGLPAWRVL